MQKTPELKPCPFCGGKAELRRDSELETMYVVVCTNCPVDFGRMWFWKKQNAIDAWNRRTEEQIRLAERGKSAGIA